MTYPYPKGTIMSDLIAQLQDYMAKAKATAQPEAYSYDYLLPGLLGEVGEVYGQIAKNHWHGWTAEKFETELVAEYGDICWMTAILLDMRNVDLELPPVSDRPLLFDPFSGMQVVSSKVRTMVGSVEDEYHIAQLAKGYPDNGTIPAKVESQEQVTDSMLLQLWAALVRYAPVVTGHPIQKALDYNAEKLASRAARGVLRGAGDHR